MSTGIVGGHFQPIALSLCSIETSIPSSRPAIEQAGARSEGQEGYEDGRAAANACAHQGLVLARQSGRMRATRP